MDYTQEEIKAAVEKLVRSSIRRSYGTLGNRELATTFSDLQEAAIGTFLLDQNSPFYVILLGAEKLLETVYVQEATISTLIEAVDNVGRNVYEVSNLSPLSNARVALAALETASKDRDSAFSDIASIPAYKRFDASTQRFLDDTATSIRKDGKVVPTPQESRATIASLTSTVKAQQLVLTESAAYLSGALQDYSTLNLPAVLSATVLSRARQVLAENTALLEAMTPEDRLTKLRDVTLDVLAARSVVKTLAGFSSPSTFIPLSGTGSPHANSSYPATPAVLTATVPGPYHVRADSAEKSFELDIEVDDSFSFLAALPGSFIPKVESVKTEPITITAGQDNSLHIQLVSGSTTNIIAPLGGSGSKTIRELADSIQTAIGANPLVAEPYVVPPLYLGAVDLTATGGATMDFVRIGTALDWTVLNIKTGHRIIVRDLTSLNNEAIYTVSTVTASTISCTKDSGAAPATETNKQIEIGTAIALRIRVADSAAATALTNRATLSIVADTTLETDSAINLGYFVGIKATARPVPADVIKTGLNQATSSAQLSTPKFKADYVYDANLYTGLKGRSDPSGPTLLVVYLLRAYGATAGGVSASFSIPDATAAGVQVGNKAVVRATTVLADQNKEGTVSAVTATSVTVTFQAPGISAATDVLLEIAPDLSALPKDAIVELSGGTLNDGQYRVTLQGVIKNELTLDKPLPVYQSFSGQPQISDASVGQYFVTFASTDVTLASSIEVSVNANPESGAAKFFNVLPAKTYGTTKYFSLPTIPRELVAGDSLELYATSFDTPSASYDISEVHAADKVVELSTVMPVDTPSYEFSTTSIVPFARIRKKQKNTFTVFSDALSTWLDKTENDTPFYRALDAALNPLVVNTNPTNVDVNAAKVKLQQLLGITTEAGATSISYSAAESLESILKSYVADAVPGIDALLATYRQKGADRAFDTLLQGRFREFFGLTQNQLSYAGTIIEGIQEVAREDFPIRKAGRQELRADASLKALWEEPDFEFDQSDIEGFPELDF